MHGRVRGMRLLAPCKTKSQNVAGMKWQIFKTKVEYHLSYSKTWANLILMFFYYYQKDGVVESNQSWFWLCLLYCCVRGGCWFAKRSTTWSSRFLLPLFICLFFSSNVQLSILFWLLEMWTLTKYCRIKQIHPTNKWSQEPAMKQQRQWQTIKTGLVKRTINWWSENEGDGWYYAERKEWVLSAQCINVCGGCRLWI